jgi:hypothetical protein
MRQGPVQSTPYSILRFIHEAIFFRLWGRAMKQPDACVIPECSLGKPSINSRQHYVDFQSDNLTLSHTCLDGGDNISYRVVAMKLSRSLYT